MPDLTQHQGYLSVLLAVAAAACWYIAVRAAAGAVRQTAWGLVLGAAIPALAGVAWLSLQGRYDGAIAVALGTAVASATLVLGIVCNIDPQEGQRIIEDPARRLKATLLPAAVTLLVLGFAGVLRLLDAVILLAVGAIVAWLAWGARRSPAMGNGAVEATEAQEQPRGVIVSGAAIVQLVLAIGLAVAGAGFAAAMAAAAGRHHGRVHDATAAILISAFIALPLVGVATSRAGAGQAPAAQRGLAMTAVLMITLGVPMVVIMYYARLLGQQEISVELLRGWVATPPALPLLMRFWRVDAVILCIAGLLMLPSAAGRFRIGRVEGVGLIVLYVGYLVLVSLAGG